LELNRILSLIHEEFLDLIKLNKQWCNSTIQTHCDVCDGAFANAGHCLFSVSVLAYVIDCVHIKTQDEKDAYGWFLGDGLFFRKTPAV